MSATEKLHQETTLFTSARSNQVHNRQVVLFCSGAKSKSLKVKSMTILTDRGWGWHSRVKWQRTLLAKNVMVTVPSKVCVCAPSCEMSTQRKTSSMHTQNALNTNGHLNPWSDGCMDMYSIINKVS